MTVTESFLIYALAALLWLLIGFGFGWVFGHMARDEAHEDDAEQAACLRASAEKRRVRAGPVKQDEARKTW